MPVSGGQRAKVAEVAQVAAAGSGPTVAPAPQNRTVAPGPPAPARQRYRARRALTLASGPALAVGRRLLAAPFCVGMIAALWLIGAVSGSLLGGPRGELLSWVGASVPSLADGHLIMIISSAFWASNLANYLLATVVLVVVGLVVERRRGTGPTAAMALGVQVVGVTAGLLVSAVLDPVVDTWGDALSAGIGVTPLPMALGLLLAHSVGMSALWRRRVRLVCVTVLAALALYGGYLEDLLTLAGALDGVLAGALLWRPAGPRALLAATRRETRSLVGLIVGISAAAPLLVASSPTAVGPLRVLRYLFTAPHVTGRTLRELCAHPDQRALCADLVVANRFGGLGPSAFAVLPALVVLVLAWGLYRGRQSAWLLSLLGHALFLVFGAILVWMTVRHRAGRFGALASTELRGAVGYVLPVLAPALVIVLLLATGSAFRVRAPVGTYRRLLLMLTGAVAVLFAVYVFGGHALAAHFTPRPGWGELIRSFPARLVPPGYFGLGVPRLLPRGGPATLLTEWTGVIIWAVALWAILAGYRRTRVAARTGDLARARQILQSSGGSAFSYLTMWQGNSYFFTSTGATYLAYRVHGGVALTTADPVGPDAERPAAIAEFTRFCDAHSWVPCLYSVTEATRAVTARAGWPDLQVAEETVLELGSLAFRGRRFQDVRTAVNRAARGGIEASWVSFPTAPRAVRDQILAISEEWVADKALPEMGFTLGGIDELDDPEVRCLVALDAAGRLHGITSWLPVHSGGAAVGWTLDFMRRRGDGFPGVMEFLIGTAALAFQDEGAGFVSLSGAPLARVQGDGGTALQRLLDMVGRTLEPVYGFRSLLAFKSKFQPAYRPLYMCFPDTAALPRIATAVGHAYLPHLSVRQLLRLAGKI